MGSRLPGTNILASSVRMADQSLTTSDRIKSMPSMYTRALLPAVMLLAPVCVAVKADTGPGHDVKAINRLIEMYVQAVDTVDLSLLSQIWSHSAEASFIYPLGEEHGFHAIEQRVFQDVMGGMFSARDLQTRSVTIHVNG